MSEQGYAKQVKACWIGGTRYPRPLTPTLDAKWRALTELDAELYVVGFSAGMRPRHFTQHARFYLLPQLPSSILRYLEMYLIAPWLLLWLVARGGVNVMIAQSPFEGAAAAFAKQIAGLFGRQVALVVESHGNFEVTLFGQRRVPLAGMYRRVMRWVAGSTFRHADVMRAVSNSTREQLERWSPGKPVEQFMAWIDADAFTQAKREIPLSDSVDLIYAGVLTPLKNVHVIIDAFHQIAGEYPNARLWLAGKPENLGYTARLHLQVEDLDLSERVVFTGAVSQRELAGYMMRSRALILVSDSEGLPRVLIEAMLAGLPVIASTVGGVPEIVQAGVNGYLVPPGDVNALVATLRTLYQDSDIDAMGERARTFAGQYFSTAAYVDGYRRLFDKAVSSTRKPRTLYPLPADNEQTDIG